VLQDEVLKKSQAKSLQCKELTAQAWLTLLKSAIVDLNSNDQVNFPKLWHRLIHAESNLKLTQACEEVTELVEKPIFLEDLNSIHRFISTGLIRQDALNMM
jgi:hypothetical protein